MVKLVTISTVGGSLLTNYALYVKKSSREFLEYIDGLSNSRFKSAKGDMIRYLRSLRDNFSKTSAELSIIVSILKFWFLSLLSYVKREVSW